VIFAGVEEVGTFPEAVLHAMGIETGYDFAKTMAAGPRR
jgi:hypothetical protein